MHQIELNQLQILNRTPFKSIIYQEFVDIEEINSYIPIPYCLIEYIIINDKLSSADKLIFLHVYSRSYFNYGKNNDRSIACSLRSISQKLSVSKSQVLASQKKLEQLGLFIIQRDKNKYNQSKPNLITPSIPSNIFSLISKSKNRIRVSDTLNKHESNLDYLERTKQFINFNYGILKFILEHDSLSSSCKILAIDLFTMWYKYHVSSNNNSSFRFLVNYQQLTSRHNCSIKSISSKLIKLEEQSIIFKKQIFARNGEEKNARHDKSIWEITFNFPNWYKNMQSSSQLHTDTLYNKTIEDELFKSDEQDIRLYPEYSEKINNSENILHNSSGVIDELIGKLNEFKKEFKKNITSFSTSSDNFHNKNEQKTDNNSSLDNDFTDNLDIATNTDDYAVCYKNDPGLSKNKPHNNRDIIIKIFKSNLRRNHKVLFDNFLTKIGIKSESKNHKKLKKENSKCFSITSELIKRKLKDIPQDKADKARKYAYSLVSKKLVKGYAASLDKHELAKQLIFHIATWKPTKVDGLTRKQEIDTALSVAWKTITTGTWQIPLGYAKAQILNYEFISYKNKYKNLDVLSPELYLLEKETDKLFGGYSNLTEILKKEVEKERQEKEESKALQLEHYESEPINPFDDQISRLGSDIKPITYKEFTEVDNDYVGFVTNSESTRSLQQSDSILDCLANSAYPAISEQINCFDKSDTLITSKIDDFMDKSLALLEADLPGQLVYFGKLEKIVTNDQGDVNVLFGAGSSDEFLRIQKRYKEIDKLQNKPDKTIGLTHQETDTSSLVPMDFKPKEESNITTKGKDNKAYMDIISPLDQVSHRLTEIDISNLKHEERLYKICPTKTDKLAVEGVNRKTFFGKLKEIEHCDNGKLRVVFGSKQSNAGLSNMFNSKIERLCK